MNHLSIKLLAIFSFCIIFPGNPARAQKVSSPKLKDLNGFFPFDVPGSLADWEKRSNKIRRQVLVANMGCLKRMKTSWYPIQAMKMECMLTGLGLVTHQVVVAGMEQEVLNCFT